MYRYNQLPKAIENAHKLGFKDGAALFPQVTNNGEECHSEWEITFEEIHRNNIIVYAILQYAAITGSNEYILKYGLEVMIAICRFWSQRVTFSKPKQQYVILGVTGPDEYQNNVDNNWYTNLSCASSLKMTLYYLDLAAQKYPEDYTRICNLTHLDYETETPLWHNIAEQMYLPEDKNLGIFVQMMVLWTKHYKVQKPSQRMNGQSTNIGHGIVYYVPVILNKVMFYWDFIYTITNLI